MKVSVGLIFFYLIGCIVNRFFWFSLCWGLCECELIWYCVGFVDCELDIRYVVKCYFWVGDVW